MTWEKHEILATGIEIYLGDCLEVMKGMGDKSVDAIITDLPYGTTACKWDAIIPFEPMWKQVKRINKGVFVTTASQPFTSKLVMSNPYQFKYEWIWDKGLAGNIFLAKYQPMKVTENVCVFSENGYTFNPLKTPGNKRKMKNNGMKDSAFGNFDKYDGGYSDERNPINIIYFPNTDRKGIVHPTQKPVALYQYLIKTYTNEGDTVLDITMGSGTTGVACVQTGRKFTGIEIDSVYYEIAKKRIQEALMQPRLI